MKRHSVWNSKYDKWERLKSKRGIRTENQTWERKAIKAGRRKEESRGLKVYRSRSTSSWQILKTNRRKAKVNWGIVMRGRNVTIEIAWGRRGTIMMNVVYWEANHSSWVRRAKDLWTRRTCCMIKYCCCS